MKNKYQHLISNTAILGIGTFSSKLLVFFMVGFYTACLSKAEYGIADFVTQTANLLIPLLSVGIAEAVFRFALDRDEEPSRVFTVGLVTVLGGGAVFLLIIPILNSVSYFYGYGLLIWAYTFFSCLHTVCIQYMRARGRMKQFAGYGILSTAVTIVCNLILLLGFDLGVTGYVMSIILSDALVTALLFFTESLWRDVKLSSVSKTLFRRMLRFSIPLIPTTVFWWVTNAADRFMVLYMIDEAANGLYAVAYKIPSLLILFSGIFIEAWQFSAVKERGDAEHSHFFETVFDSFQALMFMAGCGLTAFAKIAVDIMAAESYYPSWQYIPVLSVATIFSSLVTFMGSVYLVEKKSVLSFITSMIGAVINIVLNFLLIPTELGPNGAALATFASYFIVFIIRAVNAQKYIRFNMHPIKLTINTLLAGIQAFCMVVETPGWTAVQAVVLVLIFALNARPIVAGILQVLRRRVKGSKSA
ncbi:MAG: polysaccharide biosynthesis C-terminal domain-containing protein [Clostridia bacterium]|nr:polysaccharide biosynthesis C-terminal domain-containing protein [Clostridia bacterium]